MLALVNLRRRHPELKRPFRIKGGWPAIAAVVLVPTVVYAVGLYYLVAEEGWIRGVGWSAGAMLTGVIVFPIASRYKRRGTQDRTWRIEGGVPTSNDGRVVGEAGVERNEVTS
jgi:amino acid transporter